MKERLFSSLYLARLGARVWVFVLTMISQLILSVCYLKSMYDLGMSTIGHSFLQLLYALLHIGGWSALLWLLLAWPERSWAKRISLTLYLLVTLGFFAVEMVLLQEYHTLYNVDLALLMLSTNTREAGEIFSILHLSSFLWAGGGIVLSLLVAYALGRRKRNACTPTRRTAMASLVLAAIGVAAILPAAYAHFDSRVIPSSYTTSYERAVLSTGYGYLLSLKVEKRYAAMKDLEGLKDLQVTDSLASEPIDVVLILGESVRRDYLHSYGYPLPNTPGIDSLVASGDMVLFRDVLAPATTTNYSCQRTLTFYTNVEAKEEWYSYPNLLSAVSRAGYATAWITNQETTGIYSVSRIFSPFADIVRERNDRAEGMVDTSEHSLNNLAGAYDTSLLPLLLDYSTLPDSVTATHRRGLVEVVHLMGSHFDYAKRYPEAYARFTEKDIPQKNLGADEAKTVASYVNSIYFTDHVIKEIVKKYAQRPALVLYISDHGEVLYDDPKDRKFYGHSPYTVTPGAVQVPFMCYVSPRLDQMNPQLKERLRAAASRRISSDLLTHTLTSLLGIHTRYSNPKLDFLSPEYDGQRKRIVTATEGASFEVDY